jgi:hypothetical protein
VLKIDPRPFTLRELAHMLEGHDADAYADRALLSGIFNRLGNGADPIKINPPPWVVELQRQRELARSAEAKAADIDAARAAFKEYVGKRGGN